MWCVWTITSAFGMGAGRWIPGGRDYRPTNREGAIEQVRYQPSREGAIGRLKLNMDAANFFVESEDMAWGYVLTDVTGEQPRIVGDRNLWTPDEQTALHQRAARVSP